MGKQFTTVRELFDTLNVPRNLRLERFKTDLEYAQRRKIQLQSDLENLRSQELNILQKMNRSQKLLDIMQHYTAGRFQTVDPLQSIRPYESGSKPDPDKRINWAVEQINNPKDDPAGSLKVLNAERIRIGREIINAAQELQRQQYQILQIQDKLDPKKNGGITDLNDQMEKDAIAKKLYAEVYMLYEVSTAYSNLTHDAQGNRKFNSDPIIINKLEKYNTLFQAYSERNPYVLSGDLKLNYDDPGLPENITRIYAVLEKARQVFTIPDSQKIDAQMKKYADLLNSHITDSYASKQLIGEIETIRNPPPEDKFSGATENSAKSVAWGNAKIVLDGLKTVLSWTGRTQAEAATSSFQKFISSVNGGLPLCTPKDPEKDADEMAYEKQRKEQEAKNKAAENKGGAEASEAFKKATVVESKEILKLPNFGLKLKEAINSKSKTKDEGKAAPIGKVVSIFRSTDNTSAAGTGVRMGPADNLYQYNVLVAAEKESRSLMNLWNNGNRISYDYYETEIIKLVREAGVPVTIDSL